ncbi:hypothetical protein [Streptomyces sp. ICN988]|uniref:hypothetical protein n=1 Tax=Streptomyces sp. ICN988 TaxID=2983765 RepID=UPI00398D4B8D
MARHRRITSEIGHHLAATTVRRRSGLIGRGVLQLQEIAAEALKEVYFQDGGRRAGSLEEVRFTDIEHLEFDL